MCEGEVRAQPEDFVVTEELGFLPTGSGEHDWLTVRKRNLNTQQVVEWLAKTANVAQSAVGFAGLKDNRAVTTQSFTVWRPKGEHIDYASFSSNGLSIIEQSKHSKKLKRGVHRANRFDLVLRNISSDYQSDLEQRLVAIQQSGVPNYFGAQRFGRGAQNIPQAIELFTGVRKRVPKPLKGLLLSATRSWLFNEVVSSQLEHAGAISLNDQQWLNLQGSGSVFVGCPKDDQRYSELDIHQTAPLWGNSRQKYLEGAPSQLAREAEVLSPFTQLQAGLERFGLEYQRRASRAKVIDLEWRFDESAESSQTIALKLSFSLFRGQFATSVLRELIQGVQ